MAPHETPGLRARRRALLVTAVIPLVLAAVAVRPPHRARPHPSVPGTCSGVITPEVTRAVFNRVLAVRPVPSCILEGVSAHGTRLEVRWRSNSGPLPPVVIVPAGCADATTEVHGGYQVLPAPETSTRCPQGMSVVRTALDALPRAPDGGFLLRAAAAIALCALTLALYLAALRMFSPGRFPWAKLVLPGGVLALSLAARFAVTPLPANWYANVLEPTSPLSTGRFGPGGMLYQAVLWALFPWRDTTLFHANALVGAVTVPLFVFFLRERRVSDGIAATVGVLFALAPLHVRVSASDSDHVLSAALHVALLWAWVRAARTQNLPMAVLSLLLMPAVALVRIDAWWALGTVPLWSLLVDRTEHPLPRRTRILWAGMYTLVWACVGAVLYKTVALPSHHPFPERAGILLATRQLFSQYVIAAREAPHWVSPVAVLLALPGVVSMAFRRPALLVCIVASLAAAFIPLGRNLLHDGLLGARYFLVTLPVSFIPAGYGLRVFLPKAPGTRAGKASLPVVLTLTAVATLLLGLPAYAYRYTFQDEYVFLHSALADLPARCTVETLPIRDDAFDRDLDCCLDLGRSTLPLDFPRLRFVTLPTNTPTLPPPVGCTAYYQSAACALHETPEVRVRDAHSYALMGRRCQHVQSDGGLRLLRGGSVSPHSSNGLFVSDPPRVGLYLRGAM